MAKASTEKFKTPEDQELDKRKIINAEIEKVISKFENGERTEEDWESMMEELFSFRSDDSFHTDRAWDQNQIDRVVSLFDKYGHGYPLDLSSCFTTGVKNKGEDNTVSDLVAKSLMKRIREGKKVPMGFQREIRNWCMGTETIDEDTKEDFLFTILENLDKFSYSIANQIVCGMGDGLVSLERMEKMAKSANKDIGRVIKNIRILEYLRYDPDAKTSEDKAEYMLNVLKEDSDNFFVKSKVTQVLENPIIASKEVNRLRNKFDEKELRNYKIYPSSVEWEDPKYKEDVIKSLIYSRLSDNYAVIYGPNYSVINVREELVVPSVSSGSVDSFFEISEKKKKGGDQKTPKRLGITEVLEKEGFKKDDMDEGDYEKLLLTYKSLIELPLRDKIENELGIELKDYNVREQVQFVNFLSSKSIKEVEDVKEFLDKGKDEEGRKNRIRSFLSLEAGKEMSERIFKIGELLDPESADAIFSKYAEIIDLRNQNFESLSDLFKDNRTVSSKEIEAITKNAMKKGSELLINFSEKVKDLETQEKGIAKSEILSDLENYKEDLILSVLVYKSLKDLFKEGVSETDLRPEDLKGITFEQVTANQLLNSPEKISQMSKIYAKNYEHKPVLQKKLLEGFSDKIESGGEKVVFYIYKKDDRIIAFNRFDIKSEKEKYFASCNVRPEIAGSSIGGALIEASLNKESAENETIKADCLPETSISSHYVEKSGFVVTGIVENYENTGETVFNIERKEENADYHYREYDVEEIINEHQTNFVDNQYREGEGHIVLKFKKNSPDLITKSEELINDKGYSLTRYFFANEEDVYCAFERGGR